MQVISSRFFRRFCWTSVCKFTGRRRRTSHWKFVHRWCARTVRQLRRGEYYCTPFLLRVDARTLRGTTFRIPVTRRPSSGTRNEDPWWVRSRCFSSKEGGLLYELFWEVGEGGMEGSVETLYFLASGTGGSRDDRTFRKLRHCLQ